MWLCEGWYPVVLRVEAFGPLLSPPSAASQLSAHVIVGYHPRKVTASQRHNYTTGGGGLMHGSVALQNLENVSSIFYQLFPQVPIYLL